jgi:hypothetical protein
LLGSAYKRLVMIEGRQVEAPRLGHDGEGAQARQGRGRQRRRRPTRRVARDGAPLRQRERLAREANADNLFYPAKNGISAELRLAFLERRPAELAVDRMRAVQESLARASSERPDFWSVVGQIELRVLVAVAARSSRANRSRSSPSSPT